MYQFENICVALCTRVWGSVLCSLAASMWMRVDRVSHCHASAWGVSGYVKCWGSNWFGALGIGDKDDRGGDPSHMSDNLPAVDFGGDHLVLQIEAGLGKTCPPQLPIIRTHMVGANPIKFSEFGGVRTEENSVNFVFCCFTLEKPTKWSENSDLVNQTSNMPRRKLSWTGPILQKAPQKG